MREILEYIGVALFVIFAAGLLFGFFWLVTMLAIFIAERLTGGIVGQDHGTDVVALIAGLAIPLIIWAVVAVVVALIESIWNSLRGLWLERQSLQQWLKRQKRQ